MMRKPRLSKFFRLNVVLLGLLLAACTRREIQNPPKTIFHTKPEAVLYVTTAVQENKSLRWFQVAPTGSMEPFLLADMYVLVDVNFPFADTVVDNVILYKALWSKSPGVPVCHRINFKDGYGAIVSGDHNAVYERGNWRVTEKNYVGKVVGVIGYEPLHKR